MHQKFIYLVGDSHCISPAWQVIKYKVHVYLTINKIVYNVSKFTLWCDLFIIFMNKWLEKYQLVERVLLWRVNTG